MSIDEIIVATGLSRRRVVLALRALVVATIEGSTICISYHTSWFGSGWRRHASNNLVGLDGDRAVVWAVLPMVSP